MITCKCGNILFTVTGEMITCANYRCGIEFPIQRKDPIKDPTSVCGNTLFNKHMDKLVEEQRIWKQLLT